MTRSNLTTPRNSLSVPRNTLTQARQELEFSLDNKTVIDTFASDGFTKSGSGTPLGTWSVDTEDTYEGRSTLKLVTSGTGTGVRDYAIKALLSPINIDIDKDLLVFEIIAKVNDINGISRFYLDLFIGPATTTPNYYNLVFEGTGNKWGFNNEYETFRAVVHSSMNSQQIAGNIRGIRLQVSDSGKPITFNFAEFSVYKIPKKAYLVFTNDDGTKSGYDFIHSVMAPLGLPATIFPSSENVTAGEGGSASYMDHAECLQIEADGCEIGVHGDSGDVGMTETTISFDSASKEVRDSGSGFVTAGFIPGQFMHVSGSTKNNGKYTVETVTAGVIKVTEVLADESAGATVLLSADGFSQYGDATTLSAYIDAQKDYFINTVGVSSPMDICAYPNGEIGKDSLSYPYTVSKEKFRLCRVTHNQTSEALVVNDKHRVHAGKVMYFQSANSKASIIASISNLVTMGGIGIIVSHSILEAVSDSYNYNLTDATEIINHIKTLVDNGSLEVILFSEIDSIKPTRTTIW